MSTPHLLVPLDGVPVPEADVLRRRAGAGQKKGEWRDGGDRQR